MKISKSCTTLNLQMLDYDSIHRVDGVFDSCLVSVEICLLDVWVRHLSVRTEDNYFTLLVCDPML